MKISKISLILLIINLMAMPLLGNEQIFQFLNILTLQKIVIFALPAIYFISFVIDVFRFKKLKINSVIVAGIIYIIALLISYIFGITHNFTNLTTFINLSYIAMFAVTISMYKFETEQIKKVIKGIVIVVFIIGVIGILQYFTGIGATCAGIEKYPGALARINSTMYIATILDKFLVYNIAILFYLVFIIKKKKIEITKKQNIFIYITLLTSILAIGFTFSRSGIFMFYAITILFLIIFIVNRYKRLALMSLVIVVFFYFSPGQMYVISSTVIQVEKMAVSYLEKLNMDFLITPVTSVAGILTISEEKKVESDENLEGPLTSQEKQNEKNDEFTSNIVNDNSLASRDYFQKIGKAIVKEYPVLGIGTGSYSYIYNNQNVNNYLENDINTEVLYLYPHNFYIQFTAETGIIGIVALFSLLVIIYVKSVRNKFILLPTIFLGIIAINCTTESIFYMKDISYWIIIVFTIFTKININRSNEVIKKEKDEEEKDRNLNNSKKRVLFISSTGGHLNELMQLKPLFLKYDSYIVTEKDKVNINLKEEYKEKIYFLPYATRAKWSTYIFKYLFLSFKTIYLYFKINPDAIVTTGTHTAGPMCVLGKIFRSKIIYIETFANANKKTATGRLIYLFADLFIVQWEEMLKQYPKAKYGGGIY